MDEQAASRVCPRCGEAAEDALYCATCGLHLYAQPELPTRDEWEARRAPVTEGRLATQPPLSESLRPQSSTQRRLLWVALLTVTVGILTVAQWYRFVDSAYKTFVYAKSLWSQTPAAAAVLDAGAAVVLSVIAYAWFRDSWDKIEVSRVPAGFSAVAVVAMLGASIAGLFQATNSCYATENGIGCLSAITHVGWAGPTSVALCVLLLIAAIQVFLAAGPAPVVNASRRSTPESIAFAHEPAPRAETAAKGSHVDDAGDLLKQCPDCAEWVKEAALVCRYCSHRFEK